VNIAIRPGHVHITQISNNEATVSHLCETCAREKGIMVEVRQEGLLPEIGIDIQRQAQAAPLAARKTPANAVIVTQNSRSSRLRENLAARAVTRSLKRHSLDARSGQRRAPAQGQTVFAPRRKVSWPVPTRQAAPRAGRCDQPRGVRACRALAGYDAGAADARC